MKEAIKINRMKANLTQEECANKIGISKRSFLAKENGNVDFTISEAKCLYEILKAKLPDLTFEELFLIEQ